jgi:transposase
LLGHRGTDDQRVVNDVTGWDVLIAKFREADVDLVVIETTGGYEVAWCARCRA